MRIAIVHYWLTGMRDGELVLEALLELFPGAEIFTHVYVPEAVSERIRDHAVKTTFIHHFGDCILKAFSASRPKRFQ